jgi:hypothetical protein
MRLIALLSAPAPLTDGGIMRRRFLIVSATLGAAVVAIARGDILNAARADGPVPTFTRDVAPILYRSCVTCHRPGEIAPMSLISYEEVRPWARSIKQKVASRQMPPWFADPHFSDLKFQNDRSLTSKEIDTFVAWADGGAPKGSRSSGPVGNSANPTTSSGCRRRSSCRQKGRSII